MSRYKGNASRVDWYTGQDSMVLSIVEMLLPWAFWVAVGMVLVSCLK